MWFWSIGKTDLDFQAAKYQLGLGKLEKWGFALLESENSIYKSGDMKRWGYLAQRGARAIWTMNCEQIVSKGCSKCW